MPPFTITASPLAAALAVVLLSFLLLCKKKKKKKQLKQDKKQAGTQAVYLEKEKKKTAREGVWECVFVWGVVSLQSGSTLHTVSVRTLTRECKPLTQIRTCRIFIFALPDVL